MADLHGKDAAGFEQPDGLRNEDAVGVETIGAAVERGLAGGGLGDHGAGAPHLAARAGQRRRGAR